MVFLSFALCVCLKWTQFKIRTKILLCFSKVDHMDSYTLHIYTFSEGDYVPINLNDLLQSLSPPCLLLLYEWLLCSCAKQRGFVTRQWFFVPYSLEETSSQPHWPQGPSLQFKGVECTVAPSPNFSGYCNYTSKVCFAQNMIFLDHLALRSSYPLGLGHTSTSVQ